MDADQIAELRELCATDHGTVRVSTSTLASLLDALEDAQTSAEVDAEILAAAHAEIGRLRAAAEAPPPGDDPPLTGGWFARSVGSRREPS